MHKWPEPRDITGAAAAALKKQMLTPAALQTYTKRHKEQEQQAAVSGSAPAIAHVHGLV